jgi:outer membrane protease
MKIRKIIIVLCSCHACSIDSVAFHALPCGDGAAPEPEVSMITVAAVMECGYGRIGEYVFDGNRKLSELQWDLKPLLCPGLDFAWRGGAVYLGMAFRFGIPGNSGWMEDSDWTDGGSGQRTHYSRSDCLITGYRGFDAKLGYFLLSSGAMSISLHGIYSYSLFRMEARDGYYEYPMESGSFSGPVLKYRQAYHILMAASRLAWHPFPFLSADFSGGFSPALFCSAVDNHLLTGYEYHDDIRWGWYLFASAGCSWHMDSSISLSLEGGYFFVPLARGESRGIDKSTGTEYRYGDRAAGISMSIMRLRALCSFRVDLL